MSTTAPGRVCARNGCGRLVAGRADKRFCSDACRNIANRSASRSDPIGSDNRARATASRIATVTAIRPAGPPTWGPPSERRRPRLTGEPCPACGAPLIAARRGTWRYCGTCGKLTVPPAVTRQHDQAAGQRHVLTGSERDQRDLALAVRRDELLGRLRAAALPPGSAVAEMLAGKIRDAASERRLSELDELLGQALATSGEAAAAPVAEADISEGEIVEDEDDDDDDGVPYCYDTAGRIVPAMWNGSAWVPAAPRLAPAAPPARPLTWLGALEALGWRLAPVSDGCQVSDHGRPCGADAGRFVTGGRVCCRHYDQLAKVISESRIA